MEMSWLQSVFDGFSAMSAWETVAALLSLAYVILAARESVWCWPLAFLGSLIYTVVFWEGQLPMQAILHFYYMAMPLYGLWAWYQGGEQGNGLQITTWAWPKHVLLITVGAVLSLATAQYLIAIDGSKLPYLDATTTIFSLINTWLVTRKKLENWIYWIVIDTAAVKLYIDTGYYSTAVLFGIYVVVAIFGYVRWSKAMKANTAINH